MATIQLTDMITAVRQNADMVNDPFVTDLEITRWLNEGGAHLYELEIEAYQDTFTEPTTITIASGASMYAMTALKLRKVERQIDTNRWRRVNRVSLTEAHRANSIYRGYSQVVYHWTGGTLYFLPEDSAPGTYRLWQIPAYTNLVNGTDTADNTNNWPEFAIANATAKALAKEESDPSFWVGIMAQLKARIEAAIAERDLGQPMKVIDLERDGEDNVLWPM